VATLLPIPVRLTVCGLLEAVSVNVSVPFTVPPVVGEKVMLTEQLAEEARLDPHVLLAIAKPAVVRMLAMEIDPPEPFASVTV
jgi:hypothetical protein